MKCAKNKKICEILCGVLQVARASKESRKYAHLIWKLHEIGCISLCDRCGFRKMNMRAPRPGLKGKKGQLYKTEVAEAWSDADIDLIMIVPCALNDEEKAKFCGIEEFHVIDFLNLSKTIAKADVHPFGDGFAERFAFYLDRWSEIPAGKKCLD